MIDLTEETQERIFAQGVQAEHERVCDLLSLYTEETADLIFASIRDGTTEGIDLFPKVAALLKESRQAAAAQSAPEELSRRQAQTMRKAFARAVRSAGGRIPTNGERATAAESV
jgi:hypothetical protein